jgi:hypothetical protein
MRLFKSLVVGAAGSTAALALAAPAFAADEEIQVYMDEIGQLHKLTLDVHLNHDIAGRKLPGFAGEQRSQGRTRITPEFGYALDGSWEVGAYLPLGNISNDGELSIDGAKLRLKYIAPHAAAGFFWGANLEIGYVNDSLDENAWNGELKGIAGWRSGRWTLATNLNLGFKVSGEIDAPADIGIAAKASYALSGHTSIGLETYNSFGELSHPSSLSRNDQQIYAVMDTSYRDWDLNLGVGWGYGEAEDHFIFKAIVGVPF